MTRRGLLLFVAMCFIWGIPYLLIRVTVGEIAPVVLVFLRTSIGALILLPIALNRGGLRDILGKWRVLLVFAAVEVGVPWLKRGQRHRTGRRARRRSRDRRLRLAGDIVGGPR